MSWVTAIGKLQDLTMMMTEPTHDCQKYSTCGEASPLVTLGELNVEVRNEGVHIVIPTHLKHTRNM